MASAMTQTHRDLEICVVDDGSTDQTFELASEVAGGDPRVTILQQDNAGVAAARNHALALTKCSVTTWLDADDIWHPTKIERQLATLQAASEPPSFVYSGYRLIDDEDRIIPNFRTLVDVSGHTLCKQIATNFFSNISSIMIPTHLARKFGGHDPRLRKWGIEGAEDLLLQLQLSTVGPAACCREALVGYPMHRQNMSLGYSRAARSNVRAINLVAELEPSIPNWVLKLGRARTAGYALHMLRQRDITGAIRLLTDLAKAQPVYTALTLLLIVQWHLREAGVARDFADPDVGNSFWEADPKSAPWRGSMILSPRHDRALDRVDEILAATRARNTCGLPQTTADFPSASAGTGATTIGTELRQRDFCDARPAKG